MAETERFRNLGFEDFRRQARDPALSRHEKVGFPDSYREGYEDRIFADIRCKLTNLERKGQQVLEVGPGCSKLPLSLMELCREQGHRLVLIDSMEMLDLLPDGPSITKLAGRFPGDCREALEPYLGRVDVLLVYSVFHYVFVEGSVFDFLDSSLALLREGGQMLIGDVPNVSKRKRFFTSSAGVRFHQQFTGTDETLRVEFNSLESQQIDDAVLSSLIARSRLAGFDAYWLPQPAGLPMANRREDLLVYRP